MKAIGSKVKDLEALLIEKVLDLANILSRPHLIELKELLLLVVLKELKLQIEVERQIQMIKQCLDP
jgi:hypothetical protein